MQNMTFDAKNLCPTARQRVKCVYENKQKKGQKSHNNQMPHTNKKKDLYMGFFGVIFISSISQILCMIE